MRLVDINEMKFVCDAKDLFYCRLCNATETYIIALQKHWVKDTDRTQHYYCPECKKFLINKVDRTNEL